MKLSLRRANVVQMSIKEYINDLSVSVVLKVNQYDDLDSQLSHANEQFTASLENWFTLNDILYDIREKVSEANSEAGINKMLTHCAKIDKTIALYKSLSGKSVMESRLVIDGRLDKIRKDNATPDQRFGHHMSSDDITINILTEDHLKTFGEIVGLCKREKAAIQDKLLDLNVATKISISDGNYETLLSLDII